MKSALDTIKAAALKVYATLKAVALNLYSYVDGPAEFAGLAMGTVVTLAMYEGLLSGVPLLIGYAIAVATYIGLRPKRVGPDGAKFGDGGDGDE